MKTASLFFVLLFGTIASFAQNTITLKGKIQDEKSKVPLELSTVYLISVKDSAVIDYTVSDKNGLFKIDIKKNLQPVILKISTERYKDFSQRIEKLIASKDLGIITLTENEIKLNEVVIKGTPPPIRIKKDTLEFNASSFKVRPDANVEALIRQLPGAEIDANKKITINGKVVNKILVDGKPFFGEDGQIALQNLPADMIKKVQVSNTKTKEEELTGERSSSNNSTINLTLQEDKSKGFFGKIMGGYGTDDRYESSGIASYFKNKRRITAIVSSNNINATGFSMDDVFDNMGGGRNGGPPSPRATSGGSGITRSTTAGLNYDDQIAKKVDSHLSYNYSNSDYENNNKTAQATFLPTGNIYSESERITNVETDRNNVDMSFEYKNDKKFRISMVPKLAKQVSTSMNGSQSSSRDDNDQLLNESSSKSKAKDETGTFENRLNVMKGFEKKNRFLSATLNNTNERREGNSLINSATFFYQDATPNDIRNQNTLSKSIKDYYVTMLRYNEPVTDSSSVTVGIDAQYIKVNWGNSTFDFNETNGDYSDFNELMSLNFRSLEKHLDPAVSYNISKKALYLRARIGTYLIQADSGSDYLGTTTNLVKNYVFPDATFQLNYNFSKSKSLYFYYDHQLITPKADQILPVENLSNPLNTVVGNSNLKLATSHVSNLYFNSFDNATRSGFSFNSGFTYRDSEIVGTSVYDENGKQTTSYDNVSGTYDANVGANWNKSVKKELHSFMYSLNCSFGYRFRKGFVNSEMFSAKIMSVAPTVSLSYGYSDLVTIRPSYSFRHNATDYTNYTLNETSNNLHIAKVEATNYIHKQWVFGNDFSYNYNSEISDGFKKDFYLWNTSLSYKCKDDKWVFKVKVYDILNQNQSAMRSITENSVTDSENTVLKRYGMFSLTYKFKKFGKKLEEQKTE